MVASKVCSNCKLRKSILQFNKTYKSPKGRRAECKRCAQQKQNEQRRKAWAQQTPEQRRKHKDSSLKFHYGIGIEEYEALYAAQDGRCLICQKQYPSLYVDHNHATDVVRGLLCTQCNVGLGALQDSPALLRAAADYLEARTYYGVGAAGQSPIRISHQISKAA